VTSQGETGGGFPRLWREGRKGLAGFSRGKRVCAWLSWVPGQASRKLIKMMWGCCLLSGKLNKEVIYSDSWMSWENLDIVWEKDFSCSLGTLWRIFLLDHCRYLFGNRVDFWLVLSLSLSFSLGQFCKLQYVK
jgi:hypothetical protein